MGAESAGVADIVDAADAVDAADGLLDFLLSDIKILCVQRRNTYAFSDIIFGNFNNKCTNNKVRALLRAITFCELDKLVKNSFEQNFVWAAGKQLFDNIVKNGKYSHIKHKYDHLCAYAREHLAEIRQFCGRPKYPEWGLPKGKQDDNESNALTTVKRELYEESQLTEKHYTVISQFQPVVDNFCGSDGYVYRSIYYVGLANFDTRVNFFDMGVGEIQ